MKIDDFKGRTCNTITWTLILTIIFFIVCFVAVNDFSENSIYDEKKAYNLIKDTFLFAGTILTPLVAVFFFHDWREQHVAKELESKSQKLYMSIKKVHDKLVELSVEIDDVNNLKKDSRSKIDSEFSNVINQINHLEYCIEGINIDSKTKEFVDFASDIVDELRSNLTYLNKMYGENNKKHNVSEFNDEYENMTDLEFIEYCEEKFLEYKSSWIESNTKYIIFMYKAKKLKEKFAINTQ